MNAEETLYEIRKLVGSDEEKDKEIRFLRGLVDKMRKEIERLQKKSVAQ